MDDNQTSKYFSWTLALLKAELRKRNAKVSVCKKRADLEEFALPLTRQIRMHWSVPLLNAQN